MLAAAGWRGTPQDGALHDPCCGSGTIAIEAAQIACGIAPGLKRRFAFERLLPFAGAEMRAQWQRLKSHAESRIHPSAVPIFASDVSFRMVDFARRNAQRAGVEAMRSQFNGGDALERACTPELPSELHGTLMINPPYGERIAPKVGGKAARSAPGARPSVGRQPLDAERLLRPAGQPLEACLHAASRRLDRLRAEPRHEAAERACASRRAGGFRCGTGRSNAGCSASSWWPGSARREGASAA